MTFYGLFCADKQKNRLIMKYNNVFYYETLGGHVFVN